MPAQTNEKYSISVIGKFFTVLEKLVLYPAGVPLAELSKVTGIPKSTVFRILYTMQENGYVSQPEAGKYRLNYKFHSLFSTMPDADLREVSLRYLPCLFLSSGKIPYFYVRDGEYSVCIAKYDSTNKPIRINVNVGERVSLHSSSGGKIFLAAMSEKELDEWLDGRELKAMTKRTITDPQVLKAEIDLVRKRGYSVNNMENEDNIISVAAPVHDMHGNVIAAINAGDTILDFKEEMIPEVAKIVIRYADMISSEFGYDPSKFERAFPSRG